MAECFVSMFINEKIMQSRERFTTNQKSDKEQSNESR